MSHIIVNNAQYNNNVWIFNMSVLCMDVVDFSKTEQTDQSVFDFCFRDRFAYCTTQVNGKSGYHTSNLWKVRSNLSTEYWTVKASFPEMEY